MQCALKGQYRAEDKFNAAIKELKEDGTFDKIVGYYIDGTEEKDMSLRQMSIILMVNL